VRRDQWPRHDVYSFAAYDGYRYLQGVAHVGEPYWRPDKEPWCRATLPRLLILILPLHWPLFAHAGVHAGIGQEV
jgi:hypothetical protein